MDTNVIIDFLGNKLTSKGEAFVEKLAPAISINTRIEILEWYGASVGQLNKLLPFFDNSIIYALDEPIVAKTIELRQKHKLKTPDAIIASTAIVNKQTLITRNSKDFDKIQELTVFNPYDI